MAQDEIPLDEFARSGGVDKTALADAESVGRSPGDKRRLSNEQRALILRSQLDDPERDPASEPELRREIARLDPTGRITAPPKKEVEPTEIPLDQFANSTWTPSGDKKFGPVDYGFAYAKGLGGEAASIADIVLGIPGMALSLGANLGVVSQLLGGEVGSTPTTRAMLGQQPPSAKDAFAAGRVAGEEVANDPRNILANPVYKALNFIGSEEGKKLHEGSTATALMGKFSNLIQHAGAWLEDKTYGAVSQEAFETFADALMVGMGTKGGDLTLSTLRERMARSAEEKKLEADRLRREQPVPPEQDRQAGPQKAAQQVIDETLNIKSDKERKAYEAKRRKEIRAAFDEDPVYADYLRFLSDNRMDRADAWTPEAEAKEAREQAARVSPEIPESERPAAPTQASVEKILKKPGFERTADDLIHLRWAREIEETNQRAFQNGTAGANQKGFAKPELLARMAAVGLGGGAGIFLDPEHPLEAAALGATALFAPTLLMEGPGRVFSRFGQAGAVKGPGGMWHPDAVERLSSPLEDKLVDGIISQLGHGDGTVARMDAVGAKTIGELPEVKPVVAWVNKSVRNYLNKYAGTERDPLAQVDIPFRDSTIKWGDLTDKSFESTSPGAFPYEQRQALKTVPRDEKVWYQNPTGEHGRALDSYLSHVGDYLRQNVKPEDLSRYDLVRAVRETAANDARVAKQMEKAAQASMKDLPVYKEYPDGFKWVELKLPEKLSEEQVKGVRKIDPARIKELVKADPNEYGGMANTLSEGGSIYEAIGQDGKPIRNAYTGENAYAETPAKAHLAGQLAQEGNQMGHCVGGYCQGVASGESRIFSLRDAKGKSHVTVEVSKPDIYRGVEEAWFREKATPEFRAKYPEPDVATGQGSGVRGTAHERWAEKITATPEFKKFLEDTKNAQPNDIIQIKGKQNRAPSKEYLPYVQDFVKGGKWGDVGDLQNTGLHDIQPSKTNSKPFRDLAEEIHPGQRFLTEAENARLQEEGVKRTLAAQDKARLEQELAKYPTSMPGHRGRQEGSVDVKTVAKLAAISAGTVAGMYVADDKLTGALYGAGGALIAASVSPRGAANVFKKVFAEDDRIRINDLANNWETATARAARSVWQLQTKVEKLVPKEADRVAITHAIESGNLSGLTPKQREAAGVVRQYFDSMRDAATDAGVLKDSLDNYVTHLWRSTTDSKSALEELMGRKAGPSLSPESKFALKRTVPTIAEGMAKGLVPVSEDISTIMGIYGNAISRSMANKQMLSALKTTEIPGGGNRLVMPTSKAPPTYVTIDHPQMNGLRVHPEIAPSMQFIFDNTNPGVIMRGLEGMNVLSKRMAVSFSLFHAKALLDAFIGAAHNPLESVKMLAQAVSPKLFGENKFLTQLREGGAGDLVDKAQEAGLKFSFERAAPAVEDVRGTFYVALKDLQAGLDSIFPHLGAPIGVFTKLNHFVDKFMWERLHAGMKLSIFAEKLTALMENNAKAHARDATVPLRSEKELGEMAASFTNDIFGGLNWRRVAEESRTKWGREASLAAYSPTGRRFLQLLLFAPDWTVSTTRAALRAFGTLSGHEAGSGPMGVLRALNATDLSRQYMIRSGIYYVAVGEAINYALSGHHLWENKDPTTIDMGDGRKMQWSKHTMEPVHWLTKPGQQALNKLGFVPRELMNQMLGTHYLSTSGHAPKMDTSVGGRAAHVAKAFSPIAVQQSFDAGQGSGIAGFLGAPIYGKTTEQRIQERRERRLQRRNTPQSQEKISRRLER